MKWNGQVTVIVSSAPRSGVSVGCGKCTLEMTIKAKRRKESLYSFLFPSSVPLAGYGCRLGGARRVGVFCLFHRHITYSCHDCKVVRKVTQGYLSVFWGIFNIASD